VRTIASSDIAGHTLDDGSFLMIAGPCAVASTERTLRVARAVADAGATMLCGGAFKPRTDPRSFQGLGRIGLAMLAQAKQETGLPVVTEIVDVRDLDAVAAVADVVRVRARNMHNYGLLTTLGETDCAVLLERGPSATIDEAVNAARYVLGGGNERVILCERGIRTFETAYRFTLDLAAVPLLKQRSGLKVIVDPSHAAGRRELVRALTKAAIAVGADGIIVEVDDVPATALSDGRHQLELERFDAYMAAVHRAVRVEGRTVLRGAGNSGEAGF
jgi:3-deoxy-7-phosphoheptulonate synthase